MSTECTLCRGTGVTDGALGFNGRGACPVCAANRPTPETDAAIRNGTLYFTPDSAKFARNLEHQRDYYRDALANVAAIDDGQYPSKTDDGPELFRRLRKAVAIAKEAMK